LDVLYAKDGLSAKSYKKKGIKLHTLFRIIHDTLEIAIFAWHRCFLCTRTSIS